MEWDVSFEKGDLVVIRARGPFTVADHRRLCAEFLTREQWRPGLPVLFDNRDVDFTAVHGAELQAASSTLAAESARIGAGRTAILTRPGADFGVMRQFNLMAGRSIDVQVDFFTDESEARRWLADP